MPDVERHFDYMGWVKSQPCCLSPRGLQLAGLVDRPGRPVWSDALALAGPCAGLVEADHAGLGDDGQETGLSQRADDRTCIPLCSRHHSHRTGYAGFFAAMTPHERVAWRLAAIARHQIRYTRLRLATDAGWF